MIEHAPDERHDGRPFEVQLRQIAVTIKPLKVTLCRIPEPLAIWRAGDIPRLPDERSAGMTMREGQIHDHTHVTPVSGGNQGREILRSTEMRIEPQEVRGPVSMILSPAKQRCQEQGTDTEILQIIQRCGDAA